MNSDDLKGCFKQLSEAVKDDNNEHYNQKKVLDHLSQLETLFPLDNIKWCNNMEVSSAYQGLLDSVFKSSIMNYYGESTVESKLIDLTFLNGMHIESFFFLVSAVKDLQLSNKLDTVFNLLEKFILNGSLEKMIVDQCTVNAEDVKCHSAWKPIWEKLATFIVSLPNRVNNRNLKKVWPSFETEMFAKQMSKLFFNLLRHAYQKLQLSENISFEFPSLLLGRLCMAGFGNMILKDLTPKLIPFENDFLWRKIIQRLILGVPEKNVESVLTPLLSTLPWYGFLDFFIGNSAFDSFSVKYLLTKKLIFVRFFENPDKLIKCIGYLTTSQSRYDEFLLVFENLLDVWSKSSALKHQSEMQHFYLSSGIMICGAFYPLLKLDSKKSILTKLFLRGVQTHIENSSATVRLQGMVVGQSISSILDPEGPKLSFDFEENYESKKLLALLHVPLRPEMEIVTQSVEITCNSDSAKPVEKSDVPTTKEETLDSDDDLEPFDQSNDTPFRKEKNPVYVQDIIDGLADRSKPQHSNICLNMAQKIISSQPDYAASVCEEVVKILLHLEDNFAADNFISSRFQAMIAITVVAPERTVLYLTKQFYDRNYTIRARLDILEVLATASQELSQCQTSSQTDKSVKPIPKDNIGSNKHWSEIIQERIDAKTRRFGKGRVRDLPQPMPNRFANVAGTFFFPLLKYYDSAESSLSLLDEDSYVLGRLIYTLGIICNSAANTPILRQMAKAMLDFIWTLRYHTEASVRQALLFSVCMIFVNIPPAILLQDFQSDVFECQHWLQDVLQNDSHKECKEWAGKILLLLCNIFKEDES